MKKIIPLIAMSAMIISWKSPPVVDFIPVVGLDKDSKSEVKLIPMSHYHQQMIPLISDLSDSVSTTLDQHENTQDMPWDLTRVSVGLALKGEAEVLEYLEAEMEAEIELRFQKN